MQIARPTGRARPDAPTQPCAAPVPGLRRSAGNPRPNRPGEQTNAARPRPLLRQEPFPARRPGEQTSGAPPEASGGRTSSSVPEPSDPPHVPPRPRSRQFRERSAAPPPLPRRRPKRFGRGSGERSGRKRRARTDIAASNGLRQTAPTRNSAFLQIFLRRCPSDSRGRAGRKTGIFRHRRTHGSSQFASGTICPA